MHSENAVIYGSPWGILAPRVQNILAFFLRLEVFWGLQSTDAFDRRVYSAGVPPWGLNGCRPSQGSLGGPSC